MIRQVGSTSHKKTKDPVLVGIKVGIRRQELRIGYAKTLRTW
jgi:hypothetical protein